MTDKELRQLSRRDLLEMLIESEKENERLRSELEAAQSELQNRDIIVTDSGSLAEASLRLNGIFQAADDAVNQYIENVKKQYGGDYDAVSEAEAKAAEILKNAEEEKARKMQEADSYWEQLSSRLEAFYQSHPGLKEAITDRFGEIHK